MTVSVEDPQVKVAVAEAWGAYLESTRGQERRRYEEIEVWAWARLKARLRSLGVRLDGEKRGG